MTRRFSPPGTTLVLPVLALTLLMAAAKPASAGTVYVTHAYDGELDGIEYSTFLKVINPTATEKVFTVYFIRAFTDGTVRPEEPALKSLGVPPYQTVVVGSLTGDSPSPGMLEISGDDQLQFSALLVPRIDGVVGEGASIPIASSDRLIPAGELFSVQGWRRDSQHLTSFGLINLAQSPNQCTIDVVGADGNPRIPTVVLTLPALSQSYFHDVLDVIGIEEAIDIRTQITCPQSVAAFSHVLNTASADLMTVLPSEDLSSSLRAPGQQAACPDGADCFDFPGQFHSPSPGNEVWKTTFPLADGDVYSALRVRMVARHGGWFNKDPDGFHNFFWLFRGQWAGGTYGYVNARGPNRNLVTSLQNVGMTKGQTSRGVANIELEPGRTYVVEHSFDTGSGEIETLLLDESDNVLVRLTDRTAAGRITVNAPFSIWVGLEGHFEEVPSYGWSYQDLHVEFIR